MLFKYSIIDIGLALFTLIYKHFSTLFFFFPFNVLVVLQSNNTNIIKRQFQTVYTATVWRPPTSTRHFFLAETFVCGRFLFVQVKDGKKENHKLAIESSNSLCLLSVHKKTSTNKMLSCWEFRLNNEVNATHTKWNPRIEKEIQFNEKRIESNRLKC